MKYRSPCARWAEKLALRAEDLSPSDRAALEAHVQCCAACAAARADYRLLTIQLGNVPLPAMEVWPFRERLREESRETKLPVRAIVFGPQSQPKWRAYAGRSSGYAASIVLSLLLAATILLAPLMLLRVSHTAPERSHSTVSFDPQHTHFNAEEHTISPLNVSHLVKLWTATIGDPIWSLSVTVNGVVYVSSHNTRLYALDARTGATLWTATIGRKDGTSASCWPVVTNGVVYVGSLDSRLYALDARTGATLWTSATGDAIWSPPVIVNGVVYVGSLDSRLYAFDARTGVTLWITDVGSAISASPVVTNGIVYINSQDSMLHALDARTGATLWSTAIGNPNSSFTSSWPVVANGIVYVGSQDSRLYAFDAQTGIMLWTTDIGDPDSTNFTSSWPVVANGVVYVSSQDSRLYAFGIEPVRP